MEFWFTQLYDIFNLVIWIDFVKKDWIEKINSLQKHNYWNILYCELTQSVEDILSWISLFKWYIVVDIIARGYRNQSCGSARNNCNGQVQQVCG